MATQHIPIYHADSICDNCRHPLREHIVLEVLSKSAYLCPTARFIGPKTVDGSVGPTFEAVSPDVARMALYSALPTPPSATRAAKRWPEHVSHEVPASTHLSRASETSTAARQTSGERLNEVLAEHLDIVRDRLEMSFARCAPLGRSDWMFSIETLKDAAARLREK